MLFSRAAAVSRRAFSTSNSLRQYPFLKKLGLAETNPGVYYGGKWVDGRGQTQISINPTNNQPIASVQMGNASDYNDCVEHMQTEHERW